MRETFFSTLLADIILMPKKILIVDDEAHLRMLLEQTLEDLVDEIEVELLTASNGLEAVEMIHEHCPDLVFLDVMMPHMNGYEVCEKIVLDDHFRDLPIVLLTAKGQDRERHRGLELGACRFMTKPFNPDDILDLARQLLKLEQP